MIKLFYDSRYYVGDDMFHRLYEVASLLALATAVLHIRPLSTLGDIKHHLDMFLFCLGIVIGYLLAVGRYVELLLSRRFWKDRATGLYDECVLASQRECTWLAMPLVFYIAAMIYSVVQYSGGGDSGSGGDPYGDNETKTRNLAPGDAPVKSSYYDDVPIYILLSGALFYSVVWVVLMMIWFSNWMLKFRNVTVEA